MLHRDYRASHRDLHTERGALAGEHPGRAANPVIKVEDIAWLEFEKPDLKRAEIFARAFGFTAAASCADEVQLRGAYAGPPCVILRRGTRSRYVAAAFKAADSADLLRLAEATGAAVRPLPESIGGMSVDLTDPGGGRVRVVSGVRELAELPRQVVHTVNRGEQVERVNRGARPPRAPAIVERLGHVVLQSTRYRETLDWYLQHLGLIVSDFKYFQGQRERGPTMSFIRCDRGERPTDHHTLALTLGPRNRYVHSAYQVADLDALAAGGQYLLDCGYFRSWGIGRHIEGSQIFDYWRDPDGFLVEHFTDSDQFDASLESGWSAMTASGLAQWGPPATRDFLGVNPRRSDTYCELAGMVYALALNNEFDTARLRGLMKVAMS